MANFKRRKNVSKKFKVWLDSGANHQSCREQVVALEDIGISDAQWDAMTEEEKEAEMRDVAFDGSDWGFTEIDEQHAN
jgi:hypothetical protein